MYLHNPFLWSNQSEPQTLRLSSRTSGSIFEKHSFFMADAIYSLVYFKHSFEVSYTATRITVFWTNEVFSMISPEMFCKNMGDHIPSSIHWKPSDTRHITTGIIKKIPKNGDFLSFESAKVGNRSSGDIILFKALFSMTLRSLYIKTI